MTCTVTETLNGEWELTLTHSIDDAGKWMRLAEGNILRAPVPAAVTPRVDLVTQQYQTTTYDVQIYKITTKSGDTMTGNLNISGYLYPSLYLPPTYNSTTNRTVFEGSYVGASSFASWNDSTGNNRRMLEVCNSAYASSLDYAVMLRVCADGSWGNYRMFHAGMATPIPIANGGTGASSAKTALTNLGIFYSATLPSSGTDGQICLVPI